MNTGDGLTDRVNRGEFDEITECVSTLLPVTTSIVVVGDTDVSTELVKMAVIMGD